MGAGLALHEVGEDVRPNWGTHFPVKIVYVVGKLKFHLLADSLQSENGMVGAAGE